MNYWETVAGQELLNLIRTVSEQLEEIKDE